ncbi:hypothetical protein L7F22_026498 [Adiantum nelumboides]|nr:hypothetical protein [Adiantum nelumboides]
MLPLSLYQKLVFVAVCHCCNFQTYKDEGVVCAGQVPPICEGNRQESIFLFPWAKSKPVVLGARVNEAFESPYNFLDLLPLFKKENYLVVYSSGKRQTYVVLKESANSDDVLRATFHAQLVANILQRPLTWDSDSVGAQRKSLDCLSLFKRSCSSDMGVEAAIRESCNHVTELFEAFKHQANSQGWALQGVKQPSSDEFDSSWNLSKLSLENGCDDVATDCSVSGSFHDPGKKMYLRSC